MSRIPFWIFPFFLALGFVDPIPLYRVIREVEDYQNIEAAYTNYTANEVCFSEMHVYQKGDVVPNAGPCEECKCEPPSIVCQMTKCPVNSNGCRTIQKPNHCCPDYNCDCEYGDRIYNDGERIDSSGECQVCYCKGGEVMCTTIACYTRADCEPTHVPGQCCPTYQNCPERDPNGSNGEEKAVPKREMQPWLLTKMDTHTVPHVVLTSVSYKDLSTFPSTGQAETSLSENMAFSHRDHEATSAKPTNVLDEVVFTRVEKNSTSSKISQYHHSISEPKTDTQMNDHGETSTVEDFEISTNLVELTTTKSLSEESTKQLGNIEVISDISQTTFSEMLNPTEISETNEAKIIEERLFSTTIRDDGYISTTVETMSHDQTTEDKEMSTTELNLETTTNLGIIGKDISQYLLKDIEADIQHSNRNAAVVKEHAQYSASSTKNSIVEETTLSPTTEEPAYTEKFPTTNIHSEEYKHSTETLDAFVIGENSLEEPKNNLVVEKKVFNEEFPPVIITNTVEYLTTIPSESKYAVPLGQQNNLKKERPLDYETTQRDELSTIDFTTMTIPQNDDSLLRTKLNTHGGKEDTTQHNESELEDIELQQQNVRTLSENSNTSNKSKIVENTTGSKRAAVESANQPSANEDVETSESHPIEVEIISHDEDEDSTMRIMLDTSESDEDEDPLVIDVVNKDHGNEETDAERNVPPILELNSHVPFLQLGEDSSEETTENDGLVSHSTSESPSRPEKYLHVDSHPSLVDVNDVKEDEILDDESTTVSVNVSEDHVSSTPVIPLTPGDLKALAEFMIKEKIKPVDVNNSSLYRPNQWLEGNLTSEEKIASIMSAASVTVGLMNLTGSEQNIVPLEALKNKSSALNLSGTKRRPMYKLPSNEQFPQILNKSEIQSKIVTTTSVDSPQLKDGLTTVNTISVISSGGKEKAQLSPKIIKDTEFVTSESSTPLASEKLVDVGEARETNVNNSSKKQLGLIDRSPKDDLSNIEVRERSNSPKSQFKVHEDQKRFDPTKNN